MTKHVLSEKWIKASIIGTLWAASEIVLGSFLHNLKVPFSGNLLTAIGIVILISLSHIWTEKGLFWRAGLICAIMKTMSPSAVIFGPMVAIFSEAALLEISTRLLGKSFAGYALGGMLAMSWNLFQKIVNYIIFYGFNIVEVYSGLLKYAQKQLNIQFDIVWLPIIILLVAYCIFGLVSAIIGIRVGRRILKQPAEYIPVSTAGSADPKNRQTNNEFNYSIVWLAADLLLMIGALIIISLTSWIVWSLTTLLIVTLWAFRYKRALRQLAKPKFWIFFVILTMLTAFIFTKVQAEGGNIVQGLLVGIQMNFRAAIIIVGFSVLGTELYNPKVREFFLKTSFRELPLALELSFESLPLMIASIPEFRTIIKNPVLVVSQFISLAEYRLSEMKVKSDFSQKVFILTGAVGQGKTTQIQNLIRLFSDRNVKTGGIVSPRLMDNDITTGYDVVDIGRNKREAFLRLSAGDNLSKIGKYSIMPQGLHLGLNALMVSNNLGNQIVIIDEAGSLELEGHGWAAKITDLLKASNNHLLIVVRNTLVDKIIQKWNLSPARIFDISESDFMSAGEKILKMIS